MPRMQGKVAEPGIGSAVTLGVRPFDLRTEPDPQKTGRDNRAGPPESKEGITKTGSRWTEIPRGGQPAPPPRTAPVVSLATCIRLLHEPGAPVG